MSGLDPVHGTALEILALLRDWDAAVDPPPLSVETSGSTGRPKRVVLSRTAMRASADATHTRLGGPGTWLLALPPTYVAGLQVLFRSVRAGTEPVLEDPMEVGATYLSLVPTQLLRLLDAADGKTLSRFDAVLVGGASIDDGLRRRAVDRGVRIVTTYGMSETCGGCVYDGRPLDGVEVATTGDGRVRIRGPVLFDGYAGEPELTTRVMQDGWFVTQDLGGLTEGGRVVIGGRVDDVVVSGGVNVPAGAVAARVRSHPRVRAAELVGVPDDEWGQLLVAVVVGDVGLAELRDHVAEDLPRSFGPRRVVRLDAIPLLDNGKVDRLAVERLARA